MKNTNGQQVRDDQNEEDDDMLFDHGDDVDWNELANLYIQLYPDDEDDPDFALLGTHVRDSRCERRSRY